MKVHYPKLYNMAHLLSLNVFTASKGSNNYILFLIYMGMVAISVMRPVLYTYTLVPLPIDASYQIRL